MYDAFLSRIYRHLYKTMPGRLVLAIAVVVSLAFVIFAALPDSMKENLLHGFTEETLAPVTPGDGDNQTRLSATPIDPHNEIPLETDQVWSSGTASMTPGTSFDLDSGIWKASLASADLFYEAKDVGVRALRGWSSQLAKGGTKDFDSISRSTLASVAFDQNQSFDASFGSSEVAPGTIWYVHTSDNRFAVVRISRGGQYLGFDWRTFSNPGEGSLTTEVVSGPANIEAELKCGTGALPQDNITAIHVEGVGSHEVSLRVSHAVNPGHGGAHIAAYLLDRSGENLSGGFRPVAVGEGESAITALFASKVPIESTEIFVYMYEQFQSTAFSCKRFPYSRFWEPA